jgi:hypothetical protein
VLYPATIGLQIDYNEEVGNPDDSRMVSPFPGMAPYLEQSTFWSSFHSRLIVALASALTRQLADAVAPQILPKYYIEVETRTYSDSDESELLVGIPDAVVLSAQTTLTQSPATSSQSGIALQNRPQQQVRLPAGIAVRERYLEVRELGLRISIRL